MELLHGYLLGGLALLSVPILVHLATREKPKHLRFPAFRFLRQQFHSNQRKLKLQHLFLLALRMLLIALLCFGLARPRLSGDAAAFLGGARPIAAVLVFDTSSSAEYEANGATRLEEAKRRAQELLNEFPVGSRVAVLDSAERGGEFAGSLDDARDRIRALEVRPDNGPATRQLDRGFALLDELAREGDGTDAPPRHLFLLTDRAPASWDPADVRNRKPPDGVSCYLVDVGVEKPVDAAIEQVQVEPPAVIPGKPVRIKARIRATGARVNRKIFCQIEGDSGRPQEKVIDLNAGGEALAVFEYGPAMLRPGSHQVVVRLEGADLLPFNNIRTATFVVRPPRNSLTVMDPADPSEYWHLALESLGFTDKVVSVAEAEKEDLKKYDFVCLFQVPDPGKLWPRLGEYVEGGGRLAVVPGDGAAGFGGENAGKLLPGELQEPVNVTERGVGWEWDLSNTSALMAPFLKWRRESGNIEFQKPQGEPRVVRYWRVKPDAQARVLARYADEARTPALLEREVGGRGKVLLFTTKLSTRRERIFNPPVEPMPWQNYWKNSFGIILVDRSARYLAGDSIVPDWNLTCGETLSLPVPARGDNATYTLTGPGLPPQGQTLGVVAPADAKSERVLPITRAVKPGNYTVRDDKEGVLERFSMNVRPDESRLLPRVTVEEVEAVFGEKSLLEGTNLRETLSNRPQPFDLLPLLMVLLLLAMAAESFVANWRQREPAPTLVKPDAPAETAVRTHPGRGLLRVLMWAGLGFVAGGALGMLRSGGYGSVLESAILAGLLGAAHGVIVQTRFPPRDGAILGGLLGSMVGVLYGWLILAGAAWLDAPLAVLLGMTLGGGVMALDGWMAGTRSQQTA